MRNKFNNLFSIQYLTTMKTAGKTDIYYKIKINMSIWTVFGLKATARAKKKFNSNWNIGTLSTYWLPSEKGNRTR